MVYAFRMDLSVTEEADLRFRASLRRRVETLLEVPSTVPVPGFQISAVDEVTVPQVIDAVGLHESLIAQYDMAATIRGGGMYGTKTMENLARWLVNGATPEVSRLLKVLRDRRHVPLWPMTQAGVTPEYLTACLGANITDADVIARGFSEGIAIEFLVSVHAG